MSLWVIKIGTSLLRGTNTLSTAKVIEGYCKCIASSKDKGNNFIIVSSGSVGLGCSQLSIKNRPSDLLSLQAIAAIGQGHLMSLYTKSMNKFGYNVAQILLTRSELGTRESYINASKTLERLLEWNVIPIVNENDSISNEELKYGDNDTLSALVAGAISADQLILLTDIDRLYSSDPKINKEATPITDIHYPEVLQDFDKISSNKTKWGTGGIKTKLGAARIATQRGIKVHLADGRDSKILGEILEGSRGGTVFHPNPNPIANTKSWLANALKPVGSIHLDEGASIAIQENGASLLLVGIIKIKGDFSSNQPVKILNYKNKEIARGICSFSSEKIRKELKNQLSSSKSPVVIHRDALVLTSDQNN
tara:strand:- start:770 stop:1864 length:1095 start_codon:yes stop_codon:yes gene_type:complete